MPHFRWIAVAPLALLALTIPHAAAAQTGATPKPYLEEWVYRAKYGFQDEWWRLVQKYQIAALDEEQRTRLLEIANKCPIHKLMHGEIEVVTEAV